MTHRMVESTSDLSALIKAGVMAGSERDADFCSGGDEDDMSGLHSPSASEDSVEVQVTSISLRNKRKLAEPRKIQEPSTAPLKKRRFERIEETMAADEEECRTTRSPSPFRPWNSSGKSDSKILQTFSLPLNAPSSSVSSSVASKQTIDELHVYRQDSEPEDNRNQDDSGLQRNAVRKMNEIEEANESEIREDASQRRSEAAQTRLPRIERRETCSRQRLDTATISNLSTSTTSSTLPTTSSTASSTASAATSPTTSPAIHSRLQEEPLSLVLRGEVAGRVPSHPAVNGSYERTCPYSIDHTLSSASSSSSSFSSLSSSLNRHRDCRSGLTNVCGSPSSITTTTTITTITTTTTTTPVPTAVANTNPQTGHTRQPPTAAGQQRNYKNMTRERRIEANARERTRVHTISAAFDTLRRAIPAYSHNQKLSKLSVLRIACSYIMTLGKIVNTPEGEATNNASLGACVDLVSRTIQTEGKLRKRKED